MKIRKGTAILAPAVVLAMVAAACGGGGGGGSEGDDSGPSGQIVYGESTDWPENFFNLIAAGNATSVANMVVNVLPAPFRIMPDFTFKYDSELLSEEPTSEEVNGKQTITYKLNPDAVWSDGEALDAEDFVFSWEIQRSGDPKKGGCPALLSTAGYDQIASVEAGEDAKTVVVTMDRPFPDWKDLFRNQVYPQHILDKGDPAQNCAWMTKGWLMADGLPSDFSGGAWQIKKANIDVGGKVLVLVPNEKYWGKKPKLAKLIHQGVTNDPTVFVNDMRSGSLQLINPQPQIDLVQQIKDLEPNVSSKISFGLSFEHVDLNTRNEHLKLPEIRKAFALALDRQAIVDATVGQFDNRAKVLNNRLFVNNQPQYKDNAPDEYNKQDTAAAKALIESVGYTMGGDGIYRSPSGKKLSLEMSTTQANPLRENTLKVMTEQLKKAGIEGKIFLNPDIFAGADKPKSLEAGGYDVALFAWVSAPTVSGNVSIYKQVVGDNQGQNYTRGGNAEIDSLLDKMVTTPDPDQAADFANQADTALWEGVWTIPLYQKPTFYAQDNRYQGVQENATSAGILWNSPTWSVKQ